MNYRGSVSFLPQDLLPIPTFNSPYSAVFLRVSRDALCDLRNRAMKCGALDHGFLNIGKKFPIGGRIPPRALLWPWALGFNLVIVGSQCNRGITADPLTIEPQPI